MVRPLQSSAKLTCAGACFNIQTGDIEEAPAWDALPCFKTSVDGNDVSVEINNLGLASSIPC
jgi:nitrite reductase/ring-hydroxylating ferredoxin subunit